MNKFCQSFHYKKGSNFVIIVTLVIINILIAVRSYENVKALQVTPNRSCSQHALAQLVFCLV